MHHQSEHYIFSGPMVLFGVILSKVKIRVSPGGRGRWDLTAARIQMQLNRVCYFVSLVRVFIQEALPSEVILTSKWSGQIR